jgi:hypothetical protein
MTVMVCGMVLLWCIAGIEYISFAADITCRKGAFSAEDNYVLAQFPPMVTDLCALHSVDARHVRGFLDNSHDCFNGINRSWDTLYHAQKIWEAAKLSPQTFWIMDNVCKQVIQRKSVVPCADRYNPEKEQENKLLLINRMPRVLKQLCECNPDEYSARCLIFMLCNGTQNLHNESLFIPQRSLSWHIEYHVGKKISQNAHKLSLSPETILQLVDEFKTVVFNGVSVPFYPYNKAVEEQQITALIKHFPAPLCECYMQEQQHQKQWCWNRLTCVAYMVSHDLVGNCTLERVCNMCIADRENSYKSDLAYAIRELTGYSKDVAGAMAQQFIDIFTNQRTQYQLLSTAVTNSDTLEQHTVPPSCPVCLEFFEGTRNKHFLPCIHVLCQSCFEGWQISCSEKKRKTTCPLCRQVAD